MRRNPAVCPKAALCLLMLACTMAPSAGAQPLLTGSTHDVPDNIAPHPAPVQPLPFSHKKHLTLGLACQMCHTNPDPGVQMMFPLTETCMSCHRTVARQRPAIIRLQEFSDSGQPIPWIRVYAITPGVTWSHRPHLLAGTQCVTCHGDVPQFDTMVADKAVGAMASCIGCHQHQGADAQCVTCHAWPSDQDLGFE